MAEDLTGTWHSVYGEYGGQMVAPARVSATEWTFRGTQFSIKVLGEIEHEGTYSLDRTARPQKITIVYTRSSRFELNKPRPGIFQVSGDTFKTCFGPIGGNAPTEFNTIQGLEHILTVQQKKGAEGGLVVLPPPAKPHPTGGGKQPGGADDPDRPKHTGWW